MVKKFLKDLKKDDVFICEGMVLTCNTDNLLKDMEKIYGNDSYECRMLYKWDCNRGKGKRIYENMQKKF